MKARKSVSIFYFSLMGFLLSSTFISLTEGPLNLKIPCGWRLGLLLWVGPNGFMGLSCLTLALQREPAGRVTIIRSLEIPLAYTAQIFAFGTFPDKFSILGCLLITCGAVSITLRKIWMQVKAYRTGKDEKIQLQS